VVGKSFARGRRTRTHQVSGQARCTATAPTLPCPTLSLSARGIRHFSPRTCAMRLLLPGDLAATARVNPHPGAAALMLSMARPRDGDIRVPVQTPVSRRCVLLGEDFLTRFCMKPHPSLPCCIPGISPPPPSLGSSPRVRHEAFPDVSDGRKASIGDVRKGFVPSGCIHQRSSRTSSQSPHPQPAQSRAADAENHRVARLLPPLARPRSLAHTRAQSSYDNLHFNQPNIQVLLLLLVFIKFWGLLFSPPPSGSDTHNVGLFFL